MHILLDAMLVSSSCLQQWSRSACNELNRDTIRPSIVALIDLAEQVKDLRERCRRADEGNLELEKANEQNKSRIASLSSELNSAR